MWVGKSMIHTRAPVSPFRLGACRWGFVISPPSVADMPLYRQSSVILNPRYKPCSILRFSHLS